MENGGPAPEGITDKIYENTKTIKEYLNAENLPDVFFLLPKQPKFPFPPRDVVIRLSYIVSVIMF